MPKPIVLGVGAYNESSTRQVHAVPPVHRLVPFPAISPNHDLHLRDRLPADMAYPDADQCRWRRDRKRAGPSLDWQCCRSEVPLCPRCYRMGILQLRDVHGSKRATLAHWPSASVELVKTKCEPAVVTDSLVSVSSDCCPG